MARETALFDKLLAGVIGLGAGAVIGAHTIRRYNRTAPTTIVCTDCGKSMPVDEVLDPTVTCNCITARDSHDFR